MALFIKSRSVKRVTFLCLAYFGEEEKIYYRSSQLFINCFLEGSTKDL